MKYNFELVRFSRSGKFTARFYCEHCQQSNFYVAACLFTANLNNDPRRNLNEACKEYITNINNRKFAMFDKKKAGRELKSSLCHCSTNVVYIAAHKAKLRTRGLLKAGLNKLNKK